MPAVIPATALFSAPSIRTAFEAAWEGAEDIDAAAAAFADLLDRDESLRSAFVPLLLSIATREGLRSVRHRERKALISAASYRAQQDKGSAQLAAAMEEQRTLLDWRLSSNRRLGDATREDVEAEATMYESQAAACSVRGAWMRRIAEALQEGEVVADRFAPEELADLAKASEMGLA